MKKLLLSGLFCSVALSGFSQAIQRNFATTNSSLIVTQAIQSIRVSRAAGADNTTNVWGVLSSTNMPAEVTQTAPNTNRLVMDVTGTHAAEGIYYRTTGAWTNSYWGVTWTAGTNFLYLTNVNFTYWTNASASPWTGTWGICTDSALTNTIVLASLTGDEATGNGTYRWYEPSLTWTNAGRWAITNDTSGWALLYDGTNTYYTNYGTVGPWTGTWVQAAGATPVPTTALSVTVVPTFTRNLELGAQIQTPWGRDINGGGFVLTNAAIPTTNLIGALAYYNLTVITNGTDTATLHITNGVIMSITAP